MPISQQKINELHNRMEKLGIKEDDLVEKFILGSGPGGQKVNKTASCVYLKHLPTGIEIKCRKERSRELNRYLARRALCEQIEKKLLGEKTEKEKELAKIRKQKKRRARRIQEKLIEDKRQVSEKKKLRKISSINSD